MNYKQPPEHNKFKPGQSGNPAGRPKKIDREIPEILAKMFKLISKVKSGNSEAKLRLKQINEVLNNETSKDI